MTLAVEVAGKTDTGCVRQNNEDNFGFDSRYGIFVVCDGMGGQAAGEVASKMGVDVLLKYFREVAPSVSPKTAAIRATAAITPIPETDDEEFTPQSAKTAAITTAASGAGALARAIYLANRTIYAAGRDGNGRTGMGSTIVAALVRGHSLAIGHVGDSRIYMIRHGAIQQLTQDHSLVMEQVRLGYITREQAEKSELQNVILRALGSEEDVQPDIDELVAVPGDLILMTSDGLTRHVQDEEILAIVKNSDSLTQACNALVQLAKERGGDDNITCLLLRIVERPWFKSLFRKFFFGGQQWQNSI
ncbi:MAG: protein phosphatase 2C domain-containing protein [Acidobacteriia bacterium]|nr:protein phosphatase 2C domain-containing protein [Terriglobia bacterium]